MEDKEQRKFTKYAALLDELLDVMSNDPDEHLLVISMIFNRKLKQISEAVIHASKKNEESLHLIDEEAQGIFKRVDEYINLLKKQNEICRKHSHIYQGSEGKLQ